MRRPAQIPSPVPTIDTANAVIIPPDWPIHHPTELPTNPPIDPQIFPILMPKLRLGNRPVGSSRPVHS